MILITNSNSKDFAALDNNGQMISTFGLSSDSTDRSPTLHIASRIPNTFAIIAWYYDSATKAIRVQMFQSNKHYKHLAEIMPNEYHSLINETTPFTFFDDRFVLCAQSSLFVFRLGKLELQRPLMPDNVCAMFGDGEFLISFGYHGWYQVYQRGCNIIYTHWMSDLYPELSTQDTIVRIDKEYEILAVAAITVQIIVRLRNSDHIYVGFCYAEDDDDTEWNWVDNRGFEKCEYICYEGKIFAIADKLVELPNGDTGERGPLVVDYL